MTSKMTVYGFSAAAERAKGHPKLVARLWNVADHQMDCEVWFDILMMICWADFNR